MAKKVEKAESCSCDCNCWNKCCGGKILNTILIVLCLVAAVLACYYSKSSYDLNVLSAGGTENLNKMNNLYKSDAYKKYATDQTESYVNGFLNAYGETDNTNNNDSYDDEPDYTTTNNAADPDEIKSIVENMLASSPIRGDKDARFTIIEYTELLCPYCQRHSSAGTINSVIAQFPGEVNSISKHFIIHGDTALQLASAMECIAELNPSAYHEAFEKAFEAYPVELNGLISIATELGTDASALQSCVDEGRYTQAVEDMMNQASALFGVNGTPGNVIIDRETGNYRLVSGAYPVDEFVTAINAMKNA